MKSSADVLIVGTGAGGGTLAYRLALAGKKIIVLERGGFLRREEANWNTREVFINNRYHTKDVWEDTKGKDLHPGTTYHVGGNTKVYGAALFRLRERDFGRVQHKGGVSPEWPIKYDELEPYYTQAEKLYTVHGKQNIDPTEPRRSEDYPYPPVSNEPGMQEIEDDLKKMGLHPFPTPLSIKLNEADRLRSPCIRCSTCDAYPCLVHAKSDSDIDCIRQIMHLPNVTLITRARVKKLLTNSTGKAITSVEVEMGDSAELASFSADIVVLSCGAINSAALLLASANEQHPSGLANSSDQVGRNFMFHQSTTMLAVSRKKNTMRYMKTVSINDFYFGSRDYPFPLGNIQPLGSLHWEMMRTDAPWVAPDFALKWIAKHSVPWWLMTEDLPNSNNRVRLENGRIQLEYTQNNKESFERLRALWIHTLKEAGHADSWLHLRAYLKKTVTLEGVGHQNGTCRFGHDPKSSVLDTNCRAHDIDNLYVVDASFFPSCGAVNPSLTVIANALRVGDHLISRLKNGE